MKIQPKKKTKRKRTSRNNKITRLKERWCIFVYSKIAYERAEIARDMEYTKTNVEDSAIQDSILSIKSKMPDAFDDMDYSVERAGKNCVKIYLKIPLF